jgi:hypothetical protein
MRILICLSLCLFCVLGGARLAPVAAQDVVMEPPKGSPLRKQLLDTARPAFEREIGGPIEFVITTLNVWGPWAYGDVKLQRPGGAPIDWRRTKFAEDYAQGMLETEHNLFLLWQGGAGWALMDFVIGPTDVAWDWWRQQHKLPAELFGASSADFPPVGTPPTNAPR